MGEHQVHHVIPILPPGRAREVVPALRQVAEATKERMQRPSGTGQGRRAPRSRPTAAPRCRLGHPRAARPASGPAGRGPGSDPTTPGRDVRRRHPRRPGPSRLPAAAGRVPARSPSSPGARRCWRRRPARPAAVIASTRDRRARSSSAAGSIARRASYRRCSSGTSARVQRPRRKVRRAARSTRGRCRTTEPLGRNPGASGPFGNPSSSSRLSRGMPRASNTAPSVVMSK